MVSSTSTMQQNESSSRLLQQTHTEPYAAAESCSRSSPAAGPDPAAHLAMQ